MAVVRAAGARAELPGASSRRGDVQHRPAGPDLAGGRAGRLRASIPRTSSPGSPRRYSPRRAARRCPTCRRGPLRVARAARGSRAHARLRRGSRRDHRDLRRQAGDQPRRARDARAGRRGRDRVAELRRHAGLAAHDRRARDRRAGGPGRLRRGRARAAARPPRGEAGGAPDRVPEPRRAATSPRSAGRGWPRLLASATSSCSRIASTRRAASTASRSGRCASSPPRT